MRVLFLAALLAAASCSKKDPGPPPAPPAPTSFQVQGQAITIDAVKK